jgi:hypothetical protein
MTISVKAHMDNMNGNRYIISRTNRYHHMQEKKGEGEGEGEGEALTVPWPIPKGEGWQLVLHRLHLVRYPKHERELRNRQWK